MSQEDSLAGAVEAQERTREIWLSLERADGTVASTVLSLLAANVIVKHFGGDDEARHAWLQQFNRSVTRLLSQRPPPDKKH